MKQKESVKPSRNVPSRKTELRHHQQSFLPQPSLVLFATGSLELRLVSSAVLEHTNNNTSCIWLGLVIVNNDRWTYEGCSKWIAYFCLETSNFKLAQKYSFYALEVLPLARNAKFQPMYPLLEGVTVRWFGHSNKVLMNGRSKCLSGLVFPPSKECFQFRKQKEITWGKVWGIRGIEEKQLLFLSSKTP